MQLFLLTRDSPSLLSHAVFLSLTLQTTLLFLISGVCLGGDVVLSPGPVYGAVGGSVQFNTTIRTADRPLRRVRWEVNGTRVMTSINGTVHRGGMLYHNRVGLDIHTGSLELQNLSLSDSGNYTVTIYKTEEDTEVKGTVELLVFERISGVSLTGPTESLKEHHSSAVLTCKGTGFIITTEWMKDGQPLSPSNRIIFSADLRSVSISPVRRSDSGKYQCRLSNPVSSDTATYTMTVHHKPFADVVAGVVCGIIGGVIVALIVYLCHKKYLCFKNCRTKKHDLNVIAIRRDQDSPLPYENKDDLSHCMNLSASETN